MEVAHKARTDLGHARSLELIHRADDHFDRIADALSRARLEISMEMYQLRRDDVGRRVVEELRSAARRGVAVRLLVDPFGSARLGVWDAELRQAGVDLRWYNPWRPWAPPFRRTHRKLVIIDGQRASIGGINLAAEFSERIHGAKAWRDVGLWIEGPIVCVLRSQFEAAWQHHGGPRGAPMLVSPGAGELCALAGGRDGREGHRATYLAMVELARKEILLATPYFVPDRDFREALKGATQRGVRVVVAIPRLCDIAWFKHAARALYHELLSAGVEIWERCDRMVHAKVATVDRMVAAVGSVNLNRLSFSWNSETLLLTTERSIVNELRSLIIEEAAGSREMLCLDSWAAHPTRQRWAEALAAVVAI